MVTTIATGVGTGGLGLERGHTEPDTESRALVAVRRSLAWRRFLNDLSKAMLMTDPVAYGWYLAGTLEAQGKAGIL